MLTFYPELNFKENESLNVVLLVDCSNSMKGQPFSDALKVNYLNIRKPLIYDLNMFVR